MGKYIENYTELDGFNQVPQSVRYRAVIKVNLSCQNSNFSAQVLSQGIH
jgi:hypothetical protein